MQFYLSDIVLCYSAKAYKTLGNQYCNGFKTPRVQAVNSLLLLIFWDSWEGARPAILEVEKNLGTRLDNEHFLAAV